MVKINFNNNMSKIYDIDIDEYDIECSFDDQNI